MQTLSLAAAASALRVSRQAVHERAGRDPRLVAGRDADGRLRLDAQRVAEIAAERAARGR